MYFRRADTDWVFGFVCRAKPILRITGGASSSSQSSSLTPGSSSTDFTTSSFSGAGDTGVIGRSSGSSDSSFAALADLRVTRPPFRFFPWAGVAAADRVFGSAAARDLVAGFLSEFARRSPRLAGG